jgi:patatin-related protein
MTEQAGTAAASQRARKSREIRFGIVMYGGVSLAIYINGVATEMFNAVRGRGVYRLLKALTDADIVVDIISGTSAGGVNGVLLSYALCNDREFPATAMLWRDCGDIMKLMRSPKDSGEINSVLNSRGFYHPNLVRAFKEMPPCAQREEDVSGLTELDLFVTGTDVQGNVYTVFDDQGHAIDVKDHRTVFQLTQRHGRKEPFRVAKNRTALPDAEARQQALAKLCRITSCFPVAFEPVVVEGTKEAEAADALLRSWGRLPERRCAFLDGGVLDNKPFSYTLREIFFRMADRKVRRTLFYVEPDPEQFEQPDKVVAPNVVEAALAALVSIPGYESIADDLKLIAERNSKIQVYDRLVNMLSVSAQSGDADSSGGAQDLSSYELLRLLALSQRAVNGMLKRHSRAQHMSTEEKAAAAALYREFDDPADNKVWPRSGREILRDYDVYFRIRRLFHVVYKLYDRAIAGLLPDPVAQEVIGGLNRMVQELEIIRSAIERTLDETEFDWRTQEAEHVWRQVDAALSRLLDVGGSGLHVAGQMGAMHAAVPPSERDLADLHAALRARTADVSHAATDRMALAEGIQISSILVEFDEHASEYFSSLKRNHPHDDAVAAIEADYLAFAALDAQLFAMQFSAEIFEKDVIRTVRISPKDAKTGYSNLDLAKKVSGDTAYHFGGFFKRSWRSNDILWGRLDGLCQLVEEILRPETDPATGKPLPLVPLSAHPVLGAELAKRIREGDLSPDLLFPHSSSLTRDRLKGWLLDLLDPAPARRGAAEAELTEKRAILIQAAQLEVLHEDLPAVIADSIREQQEWNQFATANGYETGSGDRDSLVAAAAAAEYANRFIERLAADGSPEERGQAVDRHFRGDYNVGSQTLEKDVPPLVLLEFLAKALLVVRSALMTAFGKRAEAIRSTLLYTISSMMLWGFYGLVACARQSPALFKMVLFGGFTVAVGLMLVGIIWWDPLIQPPDVEMNWRRAAIFFGLPILVILSMGAILAWKGRISASPRTGA